MRKSLRWSIMLFLSLASSNSVFADERGAPTRTASEPQVAYPEGYRSWTHVKSQVATRSHPRAQSIGGIHHIYANEAAMIGYRTGSFSEGSTIVFDLLDAEEKDSSIIEGARRWIGVMVKDQRFASTQGWGYENFAGDSRIDRNVPANGPIGACYACHAQNKAENFVFSRFRQ